MENKIITKEVIVNDVTLKVTINIPENGGVKEYIYTVESVTTKGSKVDIQQLLNDEQYSIIHEWFEKDINKEVMYEINYEGRDLKAYGVWKVNEHFYDDIPDFTLIKVTKPDSNRNLLRYMDDIDYVYIDQLVSNLED